MKLKYYAIVTREGKIRRTSSGLAVYAQQKRAISWTKEGDAVVEFEIDLNQEPLYINRKVV